MARDLGANRAIDFRRAQLMRDLRDLAGVGEGGNVTLEDVSGWIREGVKAKIRPPVMIGIPTHGQLSSQWVSGYMNHMRPSANPGDYLHMIVGSHIADIRNALVEHFLEHTSYDWLFQWDADVVYYGHADPIAHLMQAAIERSALFVAGAVPVKGFPHRPNVFVSLIEEDGRESNQVVEEYTRETVLDGVSGVGGAFNLIHRQVFEKVPKPWYRFEENGLSEDLYFCRSARRAGFKIVADFRLELAHLVERALTLDDFMNIRAAAKVQEKFIAELEEIQSKAKDRSEQGEFLAPERMEMEEKAVANV